MKKTLLTAVLLGALAGSAFAQGQISIISSGGIKYSTDGVATTKVPSGNPAQIPVFGQLNIAVYSAAAGTTLSLNADLTPNFTAAWAVSQIVRQISPTAGNLPSTKLILGNIGEGLPAQVCVVGWTGTAANFIDAKASGTALLGWSGSALSTGALSWLQGTGAPNGQPPTAATPLVAGAAGFNGLVLQPIPEPSTIVLGGLGAAALLLIRRRK